MTLHAVDDIDDAIDATKSFLFPFELRQWLRMAVVVFFIGGGGTGGLQNAGQVNNFGDGGTGGTGGPAGPTGAFSLTAPLEALPAVPTRLLQVGQPGPPDPVNVLNEVGAAVVVAAALTVVLFVVLFGYLGALMEFVFSQSLIDREVHVRRYMGRHTRNGLKLFLFRIVVGLVGLSILGIVLVSVYLVLIGGSLQDPNPAALFGSFGLVFIILAGLAVVSGLVNGLTNVFVVPLMVSGEHGLRAGWRRLWGSLTAEPKQYLAYIFFSIVLGIGVSIVGTIVGLVAVFVLAIPFVVVGAVLGFGLGAAGIPHGGALAVGLVALLFLLAALIVANMIKAPLQSFLRYYAMLVLGDIDRELDPVPEVRSDIRMGDTQ